MKDPVQKLLLFDFDGVLVDSLDVYEAVVHQCLDAIGRPIVSTRADYLALYQDNFYEELARRGIDLSAFLAELARIRPHIDTSLIKPLPAVTSILPALAERHRLMLISSNSREVIEVLLARMAEEGMATEPYEWYLDLRRYGSVPHGGFGLGVERTVAWLCGLKHIRETIAFPRLMGKVYP